jgi:hypothetical protein
MLDGVELTQVIVGVFNVHCSGGVGFGAGAASAILATVKRLQATSNGHAETVL